jgi:predicted benzoate:H+ symporter BenE
VTRLCILLAALAVITRTRVPVLPGWVVPAPVLLLAVAVTVCAALAALIVLRVRADQASRPWPEPAAPGSGPEVAS